MGKLPENLGEQLELLTVKPNLYFCIMRDAF